MQAEVDEESIRNLQPYEHQQPFPQRSSSQNFPAHIKRVAVLVG